MNCGYTWDEFKYHMRIDKRLLPVKLFYFFFFAGVGILLPYIPLYQRQLGMTTIEASLINSLMPFIGSLSRPLFAMLSDKVNRHRLVLLICCLLAGLLHLLLILVPYPPLVPPAYRVVDVTCLDGHMGSHTCNKDILGIFNMCPDSQASMDTDCVVNCTFPVTGTACFKTVPTGSCVDEVTNSTSLVFNVGLIKKVETAVVGTTNSDGGGGGQGIITHVAIHRSGTPTTNGTRTKEDYSLPQPKPADKDTCSEYQLNDIRYDNSSYSAMTCTNQTVPLSCKFHCSNMKCRENPASIHHYSATFWTFMGIYMIAQVFYAPCSSLNDAISYEILGDKRHRWGRQRLWGTIGFALMAGLSGLILDSVLRADGSTNYGISCYLFMGFMILSAMSAYGLKVPENFRCSKMMKNIGILLREPMIVSLLFCVFLFGIFFGAIVSFLFWYLEDLEEAEYHNSQQKIFGLSLLMNTVAEIPMMFFSGDIIKKIGEVSCIYLAFIAYGIRFLSYAFLLNIWLVLPVELLHGLTFGLMFPAVTMYASRIAPPGMSATLQGLVSALHFGIGWGCGPLIAGPLYDAIGGNYMFLTMSIISFVSLIVFAVLTNCVFKSSRLPDAVYTINKGQPAARQLEDDAREFRDDDDDEVHRQYRDDAIDGMAEDRPGEEVMDPVAGDEDLPTPDEPLVFR